MTTPGEPTVGLLMWGDLFEDFHDGIGVSLERFRSELTGGWLFGYVEALRTAGVRTVLFHVSARVRRVERFRHGPTGAEVRILPAPRRHRAARWLRARLGGRRALRSVASYLSVPVVALAVELRRAAVDVLLAQEYEHARSDVFVALGRLLRLPFYATFQGGSAPLSRLERPLRPWAVRASSGLVVASERERRRVQAAYRVPADRIADIPNALDVTAYQPLDKATARSRLGIAPDAVVVEWHGVVDVDRKGLDVLVDAWERVLAARADADLVLLLVGAGRDAPWLRARLDALPRRAVQWRDEYLSDRAELLVYPSAADVYVLPSRREGFPVAPIEAMAAGLPVVAADAAGVADILAGGERSGGVVVPVGDAAALADALLRLVDDADLRAELGQRARRRAEDHYSLEAVGARLRTFLFG